MVFPTKTMLFAFFHCHKSRVENLWEISTPGIKSRVPRDPQVTTHRHQIARSSPRWSQRKTLMFSENGQARPMLNYQRVMMVNDG
jgi:hypothetical protein